jgi:hypothetical protein
MIPASAWALTAPGLREESEAKMMQAQEVNALANLELVLRG